MPKLNKSFKKGNKSGYRKKWRLVESLNCIEMTKNFQKSQKMSKFSKKVNFTFYNNLKIR
ncbi:hypothetical protein BpHYR1_019014 [Brachionus plicatilis]|uniref:Uncharacterized protein n=1 Tax=Brachionus plicatilis TaxID=10195 RepID=A0A3M7SE76_BRAPC|nr:hypothetical protein BpHYR1_019014 [Brachionus plicatilis]